VHEPGDALLSHPALARDHDRGVDRRDPSREIDDVAHRRAPIDDAQRIDDLDGEGGQCTLVLAQLPLRGLQGRGDPVQRSRQRLLEAGLLVGCELRGAIVAPVLAGAPDEVARRVALAHAPFLEDVDRLAGASREVAARQPADGAAHRLVGAPEVHQVLLGFIRGDERHPAIGQLALVPGLHPEQPLQGVDAGAGATPVVVAVPRELGLHGLGHSPPVGESELDEHRAGGRRAEVLYEVLPQQAHRDGVEQQGSLPGEPDHTGVGIELQQLFVIEVFDAHGEAPRNDYAPISF